MQMLFMRHALLVVLIARILLGAGFALFGLNILFHFLPMTPPPEGGTAKFEQDEIGEPRPAPPQDPRPA
jgi:hypothetical protein